MKRKVVSMVLSLTMLAGIMTGCGSTGTQSAADALEQQGVTEVPQTQEQTPATDASTEEAPAAAELDLSQQVDLVFYVMGDAPQDEELVEGAINEKLLEKCNATIDMQFSTWTDFQQKYANEITAQNADLIYIANWLNYGQLASSGAFEELDGMLDTVAPELKALVGDGALNMCRVNGSIYAVPNTWAEYVSNGVKYREDLRAKYDLPVPDSLENLEAYLVGIKENDPSQGILTVTTEESQGLKTAFDAAWVLNLKYPWVSANGLDYGLAANYDTPSDVYDYWFSDDFVDDMKMLKRWADEGLWSKSALSDTNNSDAYKNGLCVAEVAGQNPNKQITAINDFANAGEGWESAYVAYGEITGAIYPGHATQNGTAIVRGCKNPERALLVLQTLMCDEEVNALMQYGIEGTHYTVEDGIYKNLQEAAGETPTFPYEGFNTWNLRNGETKLPQATDVALQEMFDSYAVLGAKTKFPNVNIYDGFAENYESYSAERSAVSNVMRQYLAPLQAGLVDDVDAAVEEFRTKVTDAGLEKCREAYKEQWLSYCEEYGYK
jgi:putative aldouronate transport system substrate-binding protein